MSTEKIAPVQGYVQGIPWSVHLEAYNEYVKRYGRQEAMVDLEGRNCRGGFSVEELDMFIPGWRDKVSEIHSLRHQLDQVTKAAGFCDKHQPTGGARNCLVCACEKLSHALDRISYLCGEPNEYELSEYGTHFDEDAVIKQVQSIQSQHNKMRELLCDIEESLSGYVDGAPDANAFSKTANGINDSISKTLASITKPK